MMLLILNILQKQQSDAALDALAIAITHFGAGRKGTMVMQWGDPRLV